MRRKSDMFKGFADGQTASFLPGEGEQEATTAALQMRERLAMVEEQLKSQYTSIAAYAQISQHAVETARAEARADLDREKTTIVGLLERLRDEVVTASPSPQEAPEADGGAVDRIALLEDQFERLSQQFAQILKSQEELANTIAFVFEQQMRNNGWVANCADANG